MENGIISRVTARWQPILGLTTIMSMHLVSGFRAKKNRRTNGSPTETANGIAMPTAAIQRMTGKSLMENITDLIKMAGWLPDGRRSMISGITWIRQPAKDMVRVGIGLMVIVTI